MTVNKTDPRYFVGTTQADNYRPNPALRQTFTSSVTWTVPSGVTQIVAIPVGGGGGGEGNGYDNNRNAGPGGGGGGYNPVQIAVTPGENIGIIVGQGGAGGFSTTNTSFGNASTGGYSSVTYKTHEFIAYGGQPAQKATTTSYGSGGGSRGSTTARVVGSGFQSSTSRETTFYTVGPFGTGGMSLELPITDTITPWGNQQFRTMQLSVQGGKGADGVHSPNMNFGTGGNGFTAGGGGGHKNTNNQASRGGNTVSFTGGAATGVSGGGGAGVLANGNAASSSNIGGVGGIGGGGGGGAGGTDLNARGGSGGTGCVLIYY